MRVLIIDASALSLLILLTIPAILGIPYAIFKVDELGTQCPIADSVTTSYTLLPLDSCQFSTAVSPQPMPGDAITHITTCTLNGSSTQYYSDFSCVVPTGDPVIFTYGTCVNGTLPAQLESCNGVGQANSAPMLYAFFGSDCSGEGSGFVLADYYTNCYMTDYFQDSILLTCSGDNVMTQTFIGSTNCNPYDLVTTATYGTQQCLPNVTLSQHPGYVSFMVDCAIGAENETSSSTGGMGPDSSTGSETGIASDSSTAIGPDESSTGVGPEESSTGAGNGTIIPPELLPGFYAVFETGSYGSDCPISNSDSVQYTVFELNACEQLSGYEIQPIPFGANTRVVTCTDFGVAMEYYADAQCTQPVGFPANTTYGMCLNNTIVPMALQSCNGTMNSETTPTPSVYFFSSINCLGDGFGHNISAETGQCLSTGNFNDSLFVGCNGTNVIAKMYVGDFLCEEFALSSTQIYGSTHCLPLPDQGSSLFVDCTAAESGSGPESSTGVGPESSTGIGPESSTGIGPESSTGIGPGNETESSTGIGPEESSTGLGPMSSTGTGNETSTGVGPEESSTGITGESHIFSAGHSVQTVNTLGTLVLMALSFMLLVVV